jgi:hypothetical protein
MGKWKYSDMINSELRAALVSIFQVDQAYVIPKQGNWWNPEDKAGSGTWIAYTIRSSHPVVQPHMIQAGNTKVVSNHLTEIDLQIVGVLSEQWAQSVSLWSMRADVETIFNNIGCVVLADNLGHYNVSTFIQDGLNSVLAYNVRFNLISQIEISASQDVITSAAFTYTLT